LLYRSLITLSREKFCQDLQLLVLYTFQARFSNTFLYLWVFSRNPSPKGVSGFTLIRVMKEGYHPTLALGGMEEENRLADKHLAQILRVLMFKALDLCLRLFPPSP